MMEISILLKTEQIKGLLLKTHKNKQTKTNKKNNTNNNNKATITNADGRGCVDRIYICSNLRNTKMDEGKTNRS